MSFEIDASSFLFRMDELTRNTQTEAKKSMNDAAEDLARIASNIAPIDEGILRKNFVTSVEVKNGSMVGEVTFSVTEKQPRHRDSNGRFARRTGALKNNRFNYALWTHEATYKLGPKSAAAPGTDGYSVGNKYLSRPLYGEEQKYWQWVAEAIAKGMNE